MSTDPTWSQLLGALVAGQELSPEQCSWAMQRMLAGEATDAQIAGFVIGMRAKGETPNEVSALVAEMAKHANTFTTELPAMDIVGTGGDQANTVNISTMTALVVAASGIPIAKHGNRAASSQTGTADVLEELGVAIELTPEHVKQCVDHVGIGFAFAPRHHPAMRHVGQVRKELGIPTVFNILGPLSNPAGTKAMLLGVADIQRAPVISEVLAARGVRALVVRGDDGLDELSTTTTSTVWDVTGGSVVKTSFDPTALGLNAVNPSMLVGGDRVRNASLLRQAMGVDVIDNGQAERITAIQDVVALNAAAALVVYDSLSDVGLAGTLQERVAAKLPQVREVLSGGAIAEVLTRWIALSQELSLKQ